jgi:hypothetical protein
VKSASGKSASWHLRERKDKIPPLAHHVQLSDVRVDGAGPFSGLHSCGCWCNHLGVTACKDAGKANERARPVSRARFMRAALLGKRGVCSTSCEPSALRGSGTRRVERERAK